jgi:hypothetical protein
MQDKSITEIIWELFENSGKISYYLLAKRIDEEKDEKK